MSDTIVYKFTTNIINSINIYINGICFSAPIIPYLCVFVGIWCTLFLEFWKRKEKMTAMKWGMIGFEEEEQDRFVVVAAAIYCMYTVYARIF